VRESSGAGFVGSFFEQKDLKSTRSERENLFLEALLLENIFLGALLVLSEGEKKKIPTLPKETQNVVKEARTGRRTWRAARRPGVKQQNMFSQASIWRQQHRLSCCMHAQVRYVLGHP
jgi:hypothetical protein